MQIISILIILIVALTDLQYDYKLTGTLNIRGDQFYSDPIGNIYIIQGNRIQKYNNRLDKLADYSNVYLGNISSVDVSDPLRILAYYREFNQIVWLDNFLLELRSPVRLDDLSIDQVDLVCSSGQGGFWVYNNLKKQIQYFDANLRLIHESINLHQLIEESQPCSMIEKSSTVYLNVPETGILIFDRFGNYSRTLPVFPDKNFQVTDENIFYPSLSKFYKYNLSTYTNTEINLPDTTDLQSVMIQPEFLYLFQKDRICVYQSTGSN
jgi:hypothetical protein